MISYFLQKVKMPIISMVILVKDEEDIIKQNIEFHSKMGVDNFVIMDNNSSDNTRDILESLKNKYELTIIDEKGSYQQSKWMTKLNKIAKKIYNPDWIINNDADEFWYSDKNYKEILNFKGGVLQVKRSNMIIYNGLDRWENSEYRVKNQILQREGEVNTFLTKIGRKVIINPNGYFKTNSGNHSAEHIAFWKKRELEDIHIYHYPIRSFDKFKSNIENRAKLLKAGAKMGNHYKRWIKLLENKQLEKEFYNNLLFSESDISTLLKVGVLTIDKNLQNALSEFL